MKKIICCVLVVAMLSACSSSKTYFTPAIRNFIENGNQNLKKVQFYIDRDIVLRRELATGETKVTAGKVTIENGKTVNIVTIKKNTPGVCVLEKNNIVGISFEAVDANFITFGKTKFAQPNDPYRVLANNWMGDEGIINYEGKQYKIQQEGSEAGILIKSKFIKKYTVQDKTLEGRTIK